MKKTWLIVGVVVAMVALGIGMTSAYAQDNGNGGTSGNYFCDEWLLGEVQGDATGNVINLVPEGGDTPVEITVDEDTNYGAWMAPWQEVTFDGLDDGDWIAVCIKDGVAEVVILLEAPQKPFCLRLVGNVTGVQGQAITVDIGEGKTFTIDLSNSGADTTGIEEGQSVSLTISECRPLLSRYYPGLQLGWFLGRGALELPPGIKDFGGAVGRFQQRIENWQSQGILELERFQQRVENWQSRGILELERFQQRVENWQDRVGD